MESFWKQDNENFNCLNENLKVDTCIIGAGLTGLSCGYYLSKYTSVVILEKNKICSHTSGLNTGKVTSQHGLFYNYLINSNGVEFANKYLEVNEAAINNIESIIKKEKINCDFKREDTFVFTQDVAEVKKIEKEQKAVESLKKGLSEITKEIELPLDIKIAIKFKNQAKFHPVKYAYGLCDCILKNDGEIYENSQVTDIKKDDDKYIVYVNNKKVEAKHVIIATRYPFISFPGFYFLKMYQSTSFSVVADVKEKLFNGLYINSEMPNLSFRVIEDDNRKLLLAVGYDYKTGTEEIENGYAKLENVIKNMYPKAEILYKWSAEDAMSLDKIPYIGEYSRFMPNMYIATGFKKWGLTMSNVAANILSDMILGKKNEYEDLFKSTRLEPIKNKGEMKNMISQTSKSLIFSRFQIPKETLDSIKNGEGKVVNVNNTKVGVYKDENGYVFKVNPTCSHLGCELYFNNIEKIWECPCHGSKFTYDGKSIEVPSNKSLKEK